MTRAAPLLALALAGCAFLCPPDAPREDALPSARVEAPRGPLLAGAAKVDITPEHDMYMGGSKILRRSQGVHDPIWARALALRRGDVTLVIISADLVGLHHHHVEVVRARLAARAPGAAVLVHATHNHAGPDTLGMWGLPPLWTGVDEGYQARLLQALTQAADVAIADLGPARLRWGQVQAPTEGISKNRRDPALIDRTVTALGLDRPDGAPVATLVHYACHPEAVTSSNRLLSADFPQALYTAVEAARPGSVALFLNGPLGGMVTTDTRARTFEEADRIGAALGALALDALAGGHDAPDDLALAAASHPLWMPIQNRRYHLGSSLGIFAGRPFDGGHTRTEVQALRLGPVVLLAAPGEVLPRLGYQLQRLIDAPVALVVSLGNDELGYLIPEDEFDADRFRYERTVSPGPLAAPLLRRTARAALADVGALADEDEDVGRR
ncbi:MAG: neutral/alkaline non-lysosomal ceramidase N-terminal domain-containing protein [Planctomycetes bacterium]|nr:neutral/alkaline non-lysosomal ceramidase N-terminal domain-containing protein [Planctomycetota bacterium]